ncbi:hypothetical protein KEM52_001244, partial [Ascosphaera acerosa]
MLAMLAVTRGQQQEEEEEEDAARDAELARSLESLRLGIEAAERRGAEHDDGEGDGDGGDARAEHAEQITDLRLQYQDLLAQYTGLASVASSAAASRSSGPSRGHDTDHDPDPDDDSQPQRIVSSTTPLRQPKPRHPKAVRFTKPGQEQEQALASLAATTASPD